MLWCSRSVFESALKVLWILHPSDIFECESRYVVRLKQYEDWLIDQIKFLKTQNWNCDTYTKQKEDVCCFRLDLQNLLIERGYKVLHSPNLRDILKELNEDRKYLYYRLLSSYTHGGYCSTGIYRKDLGVCKKLGEFIDIKDWKLVYAVAWPVFELATEFFIDRATLSEVKNIYSDKFKKEIRDCLAM